MGTNYRFKTWFLPPDRLMSWSPAFLTGEGYWAALLPERPDQSSAINMTQLVYTWRGQDCVVEINGNHLSGTSATEGKEQTEKQEKREGPVQQTANKTNNLSLS